MKETVLIVDDEEAIAWSLRKAFEREGVQVHVTASAEDALRKAETINPSVIFLDIRLPGMDGLVALQKFKESVPDAATIIMTAHGNLSTAVRAVEGGAFDYLAKPLDLNIVIDAYHRARQRSTTSGIEVTEIDAIRELQSEEGLIVGRSAVIQNVFKRIALVAPSNACVLITGESGTGKDLVARAIHANSNRRNKPFLPVHVAALNPNLVESELFGHLRGSFTGADRNRTGLLQLAEGGTVFLDELADIPLSVQAKLLRVLERQEIQPVGGAESHRINIRLVSATNANIEDAVAQKRFRHDLFYRLNVYPIHIPPLRERPDDILLLANHFLKQFAIHSHIPQLSQEAEEELCKRIWPGNVRELRNAIEHAAIVSRGETIRPDHLPCPSQFNVATLQDQIGQSIRDWIRQEIAQTNGEPAELHEKLLCVVEPVLLRETLDKLNGNRLAAGRWLGLARATVRKLIRKYQLDGNTSPTPDDSDEGE